MIGDMYSEAVTLRGHLVHPNVVDFRFRTKLGWVGEAPVERLRGSWLHHCWKGWGGPGSVLKTVASDRIDFREVVGNINACDLGLGN